MANTKEIQKRMKSIKDTMKITNAMYMISSTKLAEGKEEASGYRTVFLFIAAGISVVSCVISPDLESIYFKDTGRDSGRRQERPAIL